MRLNGKAVTWMTWKSVLFNSSCRFERYGPAEKRETVFLIEGGRMGPVRVFNTYMLDVTCHRVLSRLTLTPLIVSSSTGEYVPNRGSTQPLPVTAFDVNTVSWWPFWASASEMLWIYFEQPGRIPGR